MSDCCPLIQIDALSNLLDRTKTEAEREKAKSQQNISALKRELDRTRLQLEEAREVGADDAERFLDLLDSNLYHTNKSSKNANAAGVQPNGMVAPAAGGSEDEILDGETINDGVPKNKTEAILSLAVEEPGGVSAR